MHNLQNIEENEVLRDALSGLNEDVPPMPEGLHAVWMQKVEDDMEDKRIEKTRNRKAFTRFLSVAAALVFVVGGTLLTRDELSRNALGMQTAQTENGDLKTIELLGARAYANDSYATEAFEEESATYDTAVAGNGMMLTSMARGATTTGATAEPAAVSVEKKIIRTASLTIQTQTYDASLTNLKALCEAEGGWIESNSENMSSSTGLRTARLTLRIPQDALDGYLAGTELLGRITSRNESATDVTASYQDTQARLDTQLALMDRLQALITESGDLSDLLALESQIADTQYMIDTLQSSLASTDRQVTYATVSVTLREETTPALTDTTVSLGERLSAAIRLGGEILVDFAQDMLVFLIAALPFIGLVAAFVVILIIVRKIRRRNKE